MLEDDIAATVTRVNELTGEISGLNERIVNVEATGDSPNDLLDRRDALVEELGTLVNIRIDDRDPDEFSIHTNGFHIVQGRISRDFALEANPENEGFSMVTWSHSGEAVDFESGKLAALVELRDVDLRDEIPPMLPETEARLREIFAPECVRLRQMLGRDSLPWETVTPVAAQ